jgi:hypothetical protein
LLGLYYPGIFLYYELGYEKKIAVVLYVEVGGEDYEKQNISTALCGAVVTLIHRLATFTHEGNQRE